MTGQAHAVGAVRAGFGLDGHRPRADSLALIDALKLYEPSAGHCVAAISEGSHRDGEVLADRGDMSNSIVARDDKLDVRLLEGVAGHSDCHLSAAALQHS